MKNLFNTLLLVLAALPAFSQNQNITLRSSKTFQFQTIANVCGWWANGREYALLGASQGLIIVDVTNPDDPQQIVQIPGPDNLWKEIKTYKNFAYVTSEGGQGLQIVDLSKLPSPNLESKFYTGDGAVAGKIDRIHALHIDVTKGFAYLYGGSNADGQLFNGGAVVCDLTDPWNPVFAGKFDQLGYIHDGYVDNDTMYASHIQAGFFSIVNMADKSAPELINFQHTPTNFTHNTWLSEDRKTLFTTDENSGSYLGAYDVSDPADIKLLDKLHARPNQVSIIHNTHVLRNYAITSWYSTGVSIVDVSNPRNLVQVGIYDTWPQNEDNGFIGCWGVYPFLPSGNLIAANIPTTGGGSGVMFVLGPNYVRACYLEGKVTDAATGQVITNTKIRFVDGDANAQKTSDNFGKYAIGQAEAKTVQVEFSKIGYKTKVLSATLKNGETVILNAELESEPVFTASGNILDEITGLPVPNAQIAIFNNDLSYFGKADASGNYQVSGILAGKYSVVAGQWGYLYRELKNQDVQGAATFSMKLAKGWRDDFLFDYGWTASGTSATGKFERANPRGIDVGIMLSPENDVATDLGSECMISGDKSVEVAGDDIESGSSILHSPIFDLSKGNDPTIRFAVWAMSVNENQEFQDTVKIYISNGTVEKLLVEVPGNSTSWRTITKKIKQFVPLSDKMSLRLEAYDAPGNPILDSYEVGFDNFQILDVLDAGDELAAAAKFEAAPNPFSDQTRIDFELPADAGAARAVLCDLTGRALQTIDLQLNSGSVLIGQRLVAGVYFVRLEAAGRVLKTLRLVKS